MGVIFDVKIQLLHKTMCDELKVKVNGSMGSNIMPLRVYYHSYPQQDGLVP